MGKAIINAPKEEVQSMPRDASIKTQDMIVLEKMSLNVFDYESIRRYRIRMKNYRPGHVWEELEEKISCTKEARTGISPISRCV